MRIAFCHPDLGIGGAERLVVDAAVELQSHKHTVHLYTAHHDRTRCFAETTNGQLAPIRIHGHWIPRHLFGKGVALFTSLRCLVVAWAICWSKDRYDAVFIDQVSTVIPLFKLLRPSMRTLFYCHFPDLLLSTRGGVFKKIYRLVLDFLEQWTTGMADCILVNSDYTATVFKNTFRWLYRYGIRPQILHPAVPIPDETTIANAGHTWSCSLPSDLVSFLKRPQTVTFLSINRFERKKNIELALRALTMWRSTETRPQLIVAGGYDENVAENREHFLELKTLREKLELDDAVWFFPSFSDWDKVLLLAACRAVVYTPENEHFGIVPLESMSFGKPVIACNSGGPKESIIHDQTGCLAEPTPEAFAEAMHRVDMRNEEMGSNGREHVEKNFSRSRFGTRLDAFFEELVKRKQK